MTATEHIEIVSNWRKDLSTQMVNLKSCPIPSSFIAKAYDMMLEARFMLGIMLKYLNSQSPYQTGDSVLTPNVDSSLNVEDQVAFTDSISVDDDDIIHLKKIREAIGDLSETILRAPQKMENRYNILENQIGLDLIKARAYLGMVFTEVTDIKELLAIEKKTTEFHPPLTIKPEQKLKVETTVRDGNIADQKFTVEDFEGPQQDGGAENLGTEEKKD